MRIADGLRHAGHGQRIWARQDGCDASALLCNIAMAKLAGYVIGLTASCQKHHPTSL